VKSVDEGAPLAIVGSVRANEAEAARAADGQLDELVPGRGIEPLAPYARPLLAQFPSRNASEKAPRQLCAERDATASASGGSAGRPSIICLPAAARPQLASASRAVMSSESSENEGTAPGLVLTISNARMRISRVTPG